MATAAAFAVTERLKLTKSPIYGTVLHPKGGFSPKCGCTHGKEKIRIKLRRGDDVTVTILDAHGHAVRELGTVRAPRGLSTFIWDGRTDGNAIAPDGGYKAEIRLAGHHQTIVLPNPITLDTKPPLVTGLNVGRETFSPDGDKQSDFVRVHYQLSKDAHVLAYLDGTRILRTYRHPARGSFQWFGRLPDGRQLPQGTYTLEVGAVDAAGNSTPVAQRQRVRVHLRYIELAAGRIAVPAGARFSIGVSTDVARYAWKLGGRKSFATGSVLRLLASTRRGRYTLTVSEHGHVARATVIVR